MARKFIPSVGETVCLPDNVLAKVNKVDGQYVDVHWFCPITHYHKTGRFEIKVLRKVHEPVAA